MRGLIDLIEIYWVKNHLLTKAAHFFHQNSFTVAFPRGTVGNGVEDY